MGSKISSSWQNELKDNGYHFTANLSISKIK